MTDFDKLELSTETLRQLTDDELKTVVGAQVQMTPGCPLTIKIHDLLEQATVNCTR
jgi:hypothetical protein